MNRIMVVGLALVMSACSANKLLNTVTVEHQAVLGVHTVIQSEELAYEKGAISQSQHQKDVKVLQDVVRGEKTLNDALTYWANISPNSPVPQEVTNAIKELMALLKDLEPLVPQNSAVATVAQDLIEVITALTNGGN